MSSDEIEQEIRRTRARMGATLDELENYLSPAHIRDEVQHTLRRTIDSVRAEYSPSVMAKKAQTTMFETIKDNPIPSITAGLSIGYLIMKGAEGNGRRDVTRRGRYNADYDRRGFGYDEDYERRRAGYDDDFRQTAYYDTEETHSPDRSTRDRVHGEFEDRHGASEKDARDRFQEGAQEARERIGHPKQRAGELANEAAERTRQASRSAGRQTEQAVRRVRHGAVSAERSLEDFVYDNPLAAGAIAVGVGALLGGLFPGTKMEDEWLGPTRDKAVGRAKRAAEATLESGRESAGNVADQVKASARDVAETAKTEAKKTAETAKNRAADEADKAKE